MLYYSIHVTLIIEKIVISWHFTDTVTSTAWQMSFLIKYVVCNLDSIQIHINTYTFYLQITTFCILLWYNINILKNGNR